MATHRIYPFAFDGGEADPELERLLDEEDAIAARVARGAVSLDERDPELERLLADATETATLVHGVADTSSIIGALLAALRQSPARKREILLGIAETALQDPALRDL